MTIPMVSGTATVTRPRLYYVDNLRIVLTVQVLLHHCALIYGSIPLFYYTEPAKDPSGWALVVLPVINQAFFMGFFFLISGLFVSGAHDRKGGRLFVRDRLVRLGIPLLAYLLLLRPLANYGGYAESGLPYWRYYLTTWDPGPTWFLEMLLVFVLLYAAWRRFGRTPVAEPPAPRPLRGRAIAAFVVALAVVTFLWRLLVPVTTYIPVLGLPTPAFLPQYAGLFVVGVVAHRRGWLDGLSRRAGRIGGFAALGSVVLVPLYLASPPGPVQTALQASWEAIFAVGVIIGMLVWFRERFDRQRRFGRFLSDHALTVYVIHPVVLVVAAHLLAGVQAIAVVKFALIAVVAVPLCWAVAYLVRSLPGAKRVL